MDCLTESKESRKGLDEEEIYVRAGKYILSQVLELRIGYAVRLPRATIRVYTYTYMDKK